MRRRLPSALQRRDYALLWVALLVMAVATQMTAVAVGWQVYSIHRNPFNLGLIGLAEFLPLPLLALPAGPAPAPLPPPPPLPALPAVAAPGPTPLLVVRLAGG